MPEAGSKVTFPFKIAGHPVDAPKPNAPLVPHEDELRRFLNSNPTGALSLINSALIPEVIRDVMNHGQAVEAIYEPCGTPVTVKQLGKGLLIKVEDINMGGILTGQEEALTIPAIEARIRKEKIKPGQKARLNIRIGPKGATAILERLDYIGKFWNEIPVKGIASSENIAHVVTRINFRAAEVKLEEAMVLKVFSPRDRTIFPPVVAAPPSKIERIKTNLAQAEKALAEYRMNPSLREYWYDPKEGRLRDMVDEIKNELQNEMNIEQAAQKAAQEKAQLASRPHYVDKHRGGSKYAQKHGGH